MLNILLIGGWGFQWLGLYQRGLAGRGCPLGNTFEIVQFVAWSAMLVYFFVGSTFRGSLLGLFTAGYAATLALVSLLIPQWDLVRGQKLLGNNPWIEAHAALAVFSYGVFGLLTLTSLMQLLQNWSLKNKRLNGLFWFLPSVVQLEQINYRLVLLGVTLLSISLSVGAAWWVRNIESVHLPKLMVTVGVWLAYLTVLLLRWRGRLVSVRFAWVCLILFGLAPLFYFNSARAIIPPPSRCAKDWRLMPRAPVTWRPAWARSLGLTNLPSLTHATASSSMASSPPPMLSPLCTRPWAP
jgi:ABC-type uncharacterized transport system permease subunit